MTADESSVDAQFQRCPENARDALRPNGVDPHPVLSALNPHFRMQAAAVRLLCAWDRACESVARECAPAVPWERVRLSVARHPPDVPRGKNLRIRKTAAPGSR